VRRAGDLRPHADRYVPHHARLAAQHHIVLEHRRAGNADMAGQHAVPSDHDVVPDLNEIINFRPLTDDRVLERAAVDAAVGADLHVVLDDHPADLGDLEVPAGPHGEAEPVLADPDAGMQDYPVAYECMGDGAAGPDKAVASDRNPVADERAGGDDRAPPDPGLP